MTTQDEDPADSTGQARGDTEPTLLGEVLSLGPRLASRTIAQIQASQQIMSLLSCAGGADDDGETVERASGNHAMQEPVDVLALVGEDTPDEPAGETIEAGGIADEPHGAHKGSQPADAGPGNDASQAADELSAAHVPEVTELMITGYDSLAASQVVPRLTTLSHDELRSVGAYEQANRGRRTILNRVRQLLASANGGG